MITSMPMQNQQSPKTNKEKGHGHEHEKEPLVIVETHGITYGKQERQSTVRRNSTLLGIELTTWSGRGRLLCKLAKLFRDILPTKGQ